MVLSVFGYFFQWSWYISVLVVRPYLKWDMQEEEERDNPLLERIMDLFESVVTFSSGLHNKTDDDVEGRLTSSQVRKRL